MGSARHRYLIAAVIAAAFGQYYLSAAFVAAAIAASRARRDGPTIEDYGQKLTINTRSTQEPVRVIYGKIKVGGNDVYMATGGADNKYLYIVHTLGEGECEGIESIGGEVQAWLDDRLVSEYTTYVNYTFHSGTNIQTVDASLNAALSEWTDPLINTAYIVWELEFERNIFLRSPARTLVLKGKKLYDFRDMTTAWSDNPVLALYDYMTNARYGMGIPVSQIDITSWTSAANYCEIKGWTLNLGIVSFQNADDIVSSIRQVFRGQPVWYNNILYLYYTDLNYESSVMPIGDDHIVVEEGSGKALITMSEGSRFGVPDGLRIGFIDPDKDYSMDNVIIGESTGVVEDFNVYGCTDKQQALDLGVYQLERVQQGEIISGTFRDDLAKLDPHDVVNITSRALNISGELVRVQSVDIRPDGLVDITFASESILFYDDDYNLTDESLFECTLPNPKEIPPEVANPNVEEQLYWYRLRSFSRLAVTFDPPNNFPWYDHCEVWRSWDNSTWEYLYDVNTDFTIDPVEEGVVYYFRLVPVSIYGIKRPFNQSTPLQKLVQGKTTAPQSMVSITAVPTDLGVNLYGAKVGDPDVELYEFRLNNWTGGVFLSAGRSPDVSLKGVKPGFFIFFCNTLGNNSVYGNTPVSASATVGEPKGWSIPPGINIPDDYTSGTFSNMEQFWYNSEWFLKCSHTETNLITNGGFDADTDWTKDAEWSIAAGVATCNNPGGGYSNMQQYCGVVFDTEYKVTFTVTAITAGRIRVNVGSYSSGYGTWRDVASGPGTYVEYIHPSLSTGNFHIQSDDFVGSIDDVSVVDTSENFLFGEYWSPIYDLEDYDPTILSPEEFLSYIEADIVVTGAGTQWQNILYEGANKLTWQQVGVDTRKWYEIFVLAEAPRVSMKMIWGSSPTAMDYEAERMEILSAIMTAKFVQFYVSIEDPSAAVNAMVENYTIKMYQ